MTEHLISREDAENDLLSCAAYVAESIASSDGHAGAMLAVVPRYLAKGNVDLAAELANTIDDPYTRDRLLTLVAEKCAEVDDDEYATQLIEAIEDFGIQSEGRERIGLIKAAKGQFDAAREIAGAMAHPDFVDAGVAAKQAADGDDEAARNTIAAIDFVSARVSALVSIAHSKLSSDATESAVHFLEEALEPTAEIEHDEERLRTFCDIGNLFIDAGRNDRAIETFDKARAYAEELDNMHRDAFFAAISIGFLRAGSQELSDRALDLVADKTQLATGLLGHARYFWQADQKNESFESLEEAYAILKSQREIETRNSKERFNLFTSIAAQFAGFKKGERAIEIAEAIEDEVQSMSALAQIASVLTLRNDNELARQALSAIPDEAQRVFALIGMSDAKSKNSEKDDAMTLLDEAEHLAETIPQLASRASAYEGVAQRYFDMGEPQKGNSTLQRSLETIETIRDEGSRAALLVNMSAIVDTAGVELGDSQKANLQAILRGA